MSDKKIDEKPSCNNCKYAIFQDYGYSNYTVEGTTFYCGKSLHPEDGFDRWYGENKKLAYASQCPSFAKGDSIELDCDGEIEKSLEGEEKQILEEWKAKP